MGGSPPPSSHPLIPHPPLQVIVFNTVREMLGSPMPLGTVALCEGNPRLFVSTEQGWLRAEVMTPLARSGVGTLKMWQQIVCHFQFTQCTVPSPTCTLIPV